MKPWMWTPGIAGPMFCLLLAGGAPEATVQRPEPVPKQESAAAQIAYATSIRSSMRGKDADLKGSARQSAVEAYRAVRAYWGSDAKACAAASFHAGEILRSANDAAAALEEFRIARERGGDSPFRVRAGLEIGHLHRRAQDHDQALAAYEAVLADAGATPGQRDDASYWEGQVYASAKRIEDARRAWQRVAESGEDPLDRIRAWDAVAGSFVDAGDLEGAAGILEKCRESMAEASAEESRLGERVRRALASMRAVDDLQRAVEKRTSREDGPKKK